ncbi:prion-inhibition and propagation-domain-containing protein [Podospora fimiseda]|uniref:Prion-inhibition and propagation-domain-containing protein n=1 Tax=Podospora fimiseda TaxID=252190 RepID=A0AAN7H523_9PEZI|nr:prion-inhibition and propagation-domain-containing protein [Podospora fimiseda]
MEVAGGIISLTWDVFDSTVRIFRFLSALVEMPKDCEKYRLQLVIEYNRVLAWGKAVGLVDVPEGSTLGAALGSEGIELVSILARIQWLLSEFRELNARYGNELNPYNDAKDDDEEPVVDEKGSDLDIARDISTLALSYEKTKEERKHLRGTNHVRKFFKKSKEVVTHPSRVRWLAIDQEEFEKLLTDLHFLTERLHELMRLHHEKQIDDITAKTYREMILTRNDVQDLRDMFDAVTSLITTSTDRRKDNVGPHKNDKALQDLIQIKKLSRTSDYILAKLKSDSVLDTNRLSSLNITVRRLTESDFSEDFEWNEDVYPQSLPRPRGIITTPEGDTPVWVEWKSMGSFPPGSTKDKEAALRTLALAEMLHLPKPASLHSPTCIAYFDDRDIGGKDLYGWIFQMPEGSDYDTRVVSLYSLLGNPKYKPSLSHRIAMAEKLCSTVLNLHAVNWLHKGIFSENVIFHFNDQGGVGVQYNSSSPLLSGFEFSRPDGEHTTARDTDIVWDLYRWPSIQREQPTDRNSKKTYDLYSLGLLLLEIAHWEKLQVLMNLGSGKVLQTPSARDFGPDYFESVAEPNVPLEESRSVRDWLLGNEVKKKDGSDKLPPFEINPLSELRNVVGDRYWRAVERCLWAHGEKGFGVEETNTSTNDAGIALQEAFTEQVVEVLRGVDI